jgi:hypothetical protein
LMSFVSWVILAFNVTFGASLNLHAEYCVHQWQAHINMVGLCYGF